VSHVVKRRRSGDPTYLVADPTAARETLKLHTVHSDLATIIRTAWAWHQKAHPLNTSESLRGEAGLFPAARLGRSPDTAPRLRRQALLMRGPYSNNGSVGPASAAHR
jgi:hypothetical protein